MTGYLLDTSVLIALVDPAHVLHATVTAAIDAMSGDDLQYVSAVSIGEIRTGVASVQNIHGRTPTHAIQVLAAAQARPLLSINTQVAVTYGDLKAAMVSTFMPKASRNKPSAHLEGWIDNATGKRLGINENDLWICAQGFERDLHVLTCDGDFTRVQAAEPRLALTVLRVI
ncbi:type II toxin-antitoxin system VapC family toxin [Rhizobium leguminosarum]|uniref:type II toxin-antitoxin system VapC family toxin n=1 Tax=Rhizobium leguminosarum TaxID=384 RepID=UPI001C958955|nr:PIN domain-containing protein [Rhizobium leguminosarum]MBY5440239.1 type II toxin-antitoxin system VapC family toxin [Rhizobium leguminosarum]